MPAWLWVATSLASIVVRVAFGIAVFSVALKPKEGFGTRLLIAIAAGLAAIALLSLWATSFPLMPLEASGLTGYFLQFLAFSALLVGSAAVVRFLSDASIWACLFCCSCGYALQNLASGASELIWVLALGTGPEAEAGRQVLFGPYSILNFAVSAILYLAVWYFFVRKSDAEGLESVSDPAMILMMAVVILMVIGFDLVIKSLSADGIAVAYIVALRSVHGFICIFTVLMEYELLINRRLEAERDTARHVLAERQRQYAQSRQTMDAINMRMHGIRHRVFQTLADAGTEVGEDTAKALLHDVSLYDAVVHTGNEALDTVLSEKRLICQDRGITLSCIADGAALGFMAGEDLYALMGAVLDEAIAASTA
ncbi:MAG: hypothetical protein ACI361_03980, partial [Atopobiaceae bacterium]